MWGLFVWETRGNRISWHMISIKGHYVKSLLFCKKQGKFIICHMVWHPPFTFGVVAHIYVLFIFPPFFLRYLMYVHLLPLPTSYFCRLSMKTFAPHATPASFLSWKPPERKMTLISFVSHSFSLRLFLFSHKWYQWLLSYMTLWL